MAEGLRPRSGWLEINLNHLSHNLQVIRSLLPNNQSVLAVVKANGYGHGAEMIAEHLEKNGVRHFGVATLEEAIKLREHGINETILIMGHMATYNTDLLFEYDLTPMIYSYRLLQAISKEANKQNEPKSIHLKIDTGMGRLGLRVEDVPRFAEEIRLHGSIELEGVATHFPVAGENNSYTQTQVKKFESVVHDLHEQNINPEWIHAMNSAAVISDETETGNLVRPGISLYGYSPLDGTHETLKPVLQAKCKMADYKRIKAGHGVSYGREWIPDETTWIGVLPIGYADGYSRLLSGKAHVLKNGEERAVLGNICMDMTVIECSEEDDPEQTVTILGKDGPGELWADTLAEWNGTISYEILSRFSERWPRLYFLDDELVALKSEQGIKRFAPPRSESELIR